MKADRDFIRSRLLSLDSWTPPEARPGGHAPAAVLVGLIDRPEGFTVLLTLRTAHLRSHAGQTALREAWEEVGLDPALVEVAGLSDPFWTRTGYLITPVVGFVQPGFTLAPNAEEVADVFEVPFAFLMDAANHHSSLRELPDGSMHEVWAMPFQERNIWGVTAALLRDLYARLHDAAPA